jgi:putative photosynthetic complex assembly protein
MSHAAVPILAPKALAAVVTALALTVLSIVGMRIAGIEAPSVKPTVAPLASRLLQIEDETQGRVIVRDRKTGEILKTFHSGEGAFFRATLRALVNDRKRRGVTTPGDFRLEAHVARQLFLIDEATGKTLALNAYGPDNAAVFAAFMFNKKGEAL